jgi:hypothetical protein
LGTLADKPTREARKEAKKPFIEWVEKYKIPRSVAYASLAEAMGIPKAECHFGWFTVEQCQQAKEALSNLIKYRGYKWMGTK